MSKIRVGIVGYGNLGKASEMHILNSPDMELVCIVSRRSNIETASKVKIVHPDDVIDYKDKIDVMVLCGGSATDLPQQTPYFTKYFNTVDSYDNHSKIPEHFGNVDKVAKESNTVSIISVGWDPGIFSLNRLLGLSILPEGKGYTFYGPGVSQGHSDAVRRVDGVLDARQYTIPVEDVVNRVRNGETPDFTKREMHERHCYVVVKEEADKEKIKKEIVNMPGYFADYDTFVEYVSKEELLENHAKLPHGGFVITSGKTSEDNQHIIEFSIKLESNPEFTSAILVAYARAAYKLSQQGSIGCHTIIDVPISLISTLSREEILSMIL